MSHPFLYLQDQDKTRLATLHSSTRYLWHCLDRKNQYSLSDGKDKVAESQVAGQRGWRLPTKDMLARFVRSENNPHRNGTSLRLHEQYLWLTAGGRCDIDEGCWGVNDGPGFIFACNENWANATPERLLTDLTERNWQLSGPGRLAT